MTKDNTALVTARFRLGIAPPELLVEWGARSLEQDLSSPSLSILAGLVGNETDQAFSLFEQVLEDVGSELPSNKEAALTLARHYASDLLEGVISADEAARRIWDLAELILPEVIPRLDPFVYAASEWDDRPDFQPELEKGIRTEARNLLREE